MYRAPKRLTTRLKTAGLGTVRALVGPARLVGKVTVTVLTIATLILGLVTYRDELNRGAKALNLSFEIPPLEITTRIEISLDPAQEARIIQAIRE